MATYQLIVDGTTYTLNSALAEVVSLDGSGIPAMERLVTQTSNAPGGVDAGYKLGPRKMALTLIMTRTTLALADTGRDALYELFRPRDTMISLRVTRDDGAVRQIECAVDGEMDMPISDDVRIGSSQRFVVPLIAPYPIWYDPTLVTHSYTYASSPITQVDIQCAIGDSTWRIYPTIKLTGAMTNVTFGAFNAAAADLVTLTTTPTNGVQSGEVLTFDFRQGYRTVKSSLANPYTPWVWDRLANTADSYQAFAKLYFKPDTEANDTPYWKLRFNTGTVTAGVAKIEVEFYKQYLGL